MFLNEYFKKDLKSFFRSFFMSIFARKKDIEYRKNTTRTISISRYSK
ncbi:hypothetical protein HMPREF9456_02355 [Dysgonomonas mossii DSM 22836]|uniref:DUF4372 domain-containing protein n=1 Tax=Dysgonomonas mossii DSM 22836 TaxID=742767 RepID=F8X1V7_9BACT|nr:hypothetical protein HMPREF9456_02355 [Dysgonomonas mossii DSM 22836]